MNEIELNNIINKNKYQVFFMSTPLPLPLSFITHTFVITNNMGEINRRDIWVSKNMNQIKDNSYLYKNLFENVFDGNKIIPFTNLLNPKTKRFGIKLIGKVEGDKNSIAKKMIEFISKSEINYMFSNKYRYLPGPNSNTFPQWILNNFPEVKIKLPNNAWGKNYAKNGKIIRKI